MANKTSPAEGTVPGTLQRGKACLRCRSGTDISQRCDGAKPACQQCTRAKKGETCEYDDGKGKTRTQILRETILRLEQKVRDLEDPDYVSPAVTLYDPQALRGFSESPPSSSYGSADASFSAGHSPFPSGASLPSRPPKVLTPPPCRLFFQEPQPQIPPVDLALMLLEIFAPHRHQCGLELDIGQLKESLTRPRAEQRHPVLMNSIFLWTCFVSRPEPLSQHEAHYLAVALDALRDALAEGERMLDIVQAECILATYFLANGRSLEGSYHASAAAALAVQCGLHASASVLPLPETMAGDRWLPDCDDMKPYKVDLCQGERILAFWQVYNLDRCWSVALRKPTIIPDGPHAWNSINCPWPLDIAEYQACAVASGVNFQTIKSFVEGDVASDGYSTQALRAKASALFERADTLCTGWDSHIKPSDAFHQEIRALEHTINAFVATLPPVHALDSTAAAEDKPLLVAAHTLAHAATIHLFQRAAPDGPAARAAARACGAVVAQLAEGDFAFLEPVLGPCWEAAAETLVRELGHQGWVPMGVGVGVNGTAAAGVRNELGTIVYAMTTLAARFPLLGISVAKIQKRLAEL
ncbi:hypothetical protein GGX14DRAFT_619987 [Mycena pura]|uniref:Xylanolytic transcriptional activator regulatory domain-containing protein n=1 Tax=Mycena pura TaxID=153505 RepID=A0AAD6YGX0_9AGAR|nr:hypothetical protein GGX14DRAFT_619987 [Mycena pura]